MKKLLSLVLALAMLLTMMTTVFAEEPIVIPVDFNTSINTELTIVYYLPLDVGNEAKKAEAVFELRLTASNERGNYEYGD